MTNIHQRVAGNGERGLSLLGQRGQMGFLHAPAGDTYKGQ